MQCGAFDIVTFDKILSTTGAVTVGSLNASNGRLTTQTLVALPYDAGTPLTLTGANLVDTYMVVGDLTTGVMEYDIPVAGDIVAAFTAAGKPLATGDFFTIYIFRGDVTSPELNALTIGLAAGVHPVTFATSGVTNVTMAANTTLQLKFEVTDVTTPAIRIHRILG